MNLTSAHPVTLGAALDWLPVLLITAGLAVLGWTVARHRARVVRPISRPLGEPAAQVGLEAVLRDAEELAQRLAADLDARADRLERLLTLADERLSRLESGGSGMEPKTPRRTPVVAPADGARDPLNRDVYALADEGLTPVAIARRLEQPTGKVELILALRGR
jgi:hypothetical protein